MKWFIFKDMEMKGILLTILLVVSGGGFLTAQNRHEKILKAYKSNWNKVIPRYQKIQYAGSMGLISVGTGWDYGKKKQWETDFFVGYLPKFDGNDGHVTVTLKQNYIPWKQTIKKSKWGVEPFSVSLYINKIFGDNFWTREPDKYPDGYYGLATNLRFNIAFGQRLYFKIKPMALSDEVAFFYEVGTNDLYIISAFTNKYLHFSDIFSLSLGIKLQFM